MKILNELQKTLGNKGIGITLEQANGAQYTKYFLFSQIKQAEKFFNSQKKEHGKKISVNINKVIY